MEKDRIAKASSSGQQTAPMITLAAAALTERFVPAPQLILHKASVVRCVHFIFKERCCVRQNLDAENSVEGACHIIPDLDVVV